MTLPRIYLAIDNCFASKRWTEPDEWAALISSLGLYYVEASADNECDPFFTTPEYLADWREAVRDAADNAGVHIANLYSGHGTYATLGLAHTDVRIRDHMHHDWLETMVRSAAALECGLGFFCHAFPESVLQDTVRYAQAKSDLYSRLAELAHYGAEVGSGPLGVEQMYSPHQVPWRIDEAEDLLRQVYAAADAPFYLTLDVGHQSGQRRFLRPDRNALERALAQAKEGATSEGQWLGPQTAWELLDGQAGRADDDRLLQQIEAEIDAYPHMFAAYEDGDPYAWLERLGGYSPIIHLQQTPGNTSSHLAFTPENNARGIIDPPKVLRALRTAYETPAADGMPPRCEAIYLTLEIFSGTADIPRDLLRRIRQSVEYWRRYVPQDGLELDELLANLPD